jgi:hypothetical protein
MVGTAAALAVRRMAAVALGVATDQLEGEATRALRADVFNITPADVPSALDVGGVGGFLQGTRVEFGRYIRGNTFVGLATRPVLSWPGARVQHRFGESGYRLEASSEQRFVLRTPSLSSQDARTRNTFGLFLIKEWRY